MAYQFICSHGCKAEEPGTCPEHLCELLQARFRCTACAYTALDEGYCPFCKVTLAQADACESAPAAA